MNKQEAEKRIIKLRNLINRHRYEYHVMDKQEISEEALDSLKHELYRLENLFPELISIDSPTQRIGGLPLEKFGKKEHKKPMLSLEDIFSKNELEEWQNYLKRLAREEEFNYFCELKVDGLAVSLIYHNMVFSFGLTRGDGKFGEDVSQNLKTIESIPLRLEKIETEKFALKNFQKEIEIRGEVYMGLADFKKINSRLQNNYSNPRNLAAGSIRQLDPKLAASRPLKFIAYSIATDIGQKNHSEEHQILKMLGFKADRGRLCKNILEVVDYWQEASQKREKLAFQVDGVVATLNEKKLFEKLGVAGKSPRGSRALKFSPKKATTRIIDVKLQIGRTGAVTPIAVLEPIEIDGVTISRATLHNEEEISRLGLKIGDTVIVQRAGDVIPIISKVLTELRVGKERNFNFPEHCPDCFSKLIKPEGEVVLRCLNKACPSREKKNLYHFTSKKAFNIDGLGPKIIDKLVKENLISSPADIFSLKESNLFNLENFGQKSAQNLINSIENSKKIDFSKFIFGLGIRHLGEETAFDLANYFKTITELRKAEMAELEKIPEIGFKTAQSIYSWFRFKKNIELIDRLIESGIKIVNQKKFSQAKFKGEKFVLTGTLDSFTRDGAYQKIRFLGGNISGNITSQTDYLITGKNSGSKLEKAKNLGVKIINEKEFLKMIK